MGWRERDITDSGNKDGALNEDRRVVYFVDQPAHLAHDPGQSVNTGAGFQPPVVRGFPHPRIAGLYADSFDVTQQTDTSCEIAASFTTAAAAFNTQTAVQQTAHKREAQFKRETAKIPIVHETRTKPIGAAVGTTPVPTFEIDKFEIIETQKIMQRMVVLTTMTTAIEDAIEAQDNAIHMFGTVPARFEAGDIVQHGPGEWHVLYTWYRDKGTRALKATAIGEPNLPGTTTGEPSIIASPITYGPAPASGQPDRRVRTYYPPETTNLLRAHLPFGDTKKYVRSPFHEIQVILHHEEPPAFVQFFPFRVESNPAVGPANGLGWQLLPGSPLP